MIKTPYILQSVANLLTGVAGLRNDVSQIRSQMASLVGVDGSSAVFKNLNCWVRDQNGLYHLLSCVVVDGSAQLSLDNTGYAYNSIP